MTEPPSPLAEPSSKGKFAPLIEFNIFPLSVLAMVQVMATFAVADAPEVEGGTHGNTYNGASLHWVWVLYFQWGTYLFNSIIEFHFSLNLQNRGFILRYSLGLPWWAWAS